MNILIVDDTPINLKLLRVQLEDEGHAVFEAHNGVDALALLERQRVDVVISDIFMPEMDGYRLSYEIRKHARLHDLPIILCTSTYTSPGDEKLVLDVGADKYLKRPVSLETLVAALREVIAMPHAAPQPKALQEVEVLKEYSERLVSKLEEKNTELQAAEVKFRTLVEQSIVGIYIVQDDQFVYVNPGMQKIFGWSEAEMTSRTVSDFVVPEDHALARENIRTRISGEVSSIRYDLRVLHQSGAVLQVEVQGSRTEYNGRPAVMGMLVDITERKRAEEATQRSQKRLRDLIDGLGPSMFVGLMTPQGILIEANRPALAAAGLKPEDVLGKPFEETYWWSYSQEIQQQLREAIARAARGEASRFDVQNRVAGNHLIDVDFALQPLWDETGEVVFLVPSANVITERKQTENALRASEARLRAIIDNEPECVKLVDKDGLLLEMNPAGLRMIEADSLPQMQNQSINNIIVEEHRAAFRALLGKTLRGESGTLEFDIIGLKGTRRTLDTHAVPLRDATGAVTSMLGITRDITERKAAAESLRLQSAMLHAAADAIVITDRAGVMEWVNPAFTQLTGYTAEEALGKKLEDLVKSGKHAPAFYKEFWETILARRTWHGEIINRRKDGRLYTEDQVVTPILDAAGAITHFVAIRRDITERKAAEARIVHLNRVYAMLSGINTLIVRVHDRDELFREACRIAVEAGGFRMALIGIVDRSALKIVPVASAGKDEALLTAVKGLLSSSEDAPNTMLARAIRDKKTVVSNDSQSDPRVLIGKKYTESGVRSMAVFPLIVSDEAVGVLALYASESEFFQEEELKLLTELADNVAFGIGNIRSRRKRLQADAKVREQSSILDKAQNAIEIRDLQHKVLYWNQGAERLYGWTAAEAVGRSVLGLMRDPADFARAMDQLLAAGEWVGELLQVDKDGSPLVAEGHWTLVHDDQGAPTHVLAINIDIRERKKAQEEIFRLNASLEERVQQRTAQLEFANKQLEAFSYSVSHDLRSPLSAIDGFSNLLGKTMARTAGDPLTERSRHYLARIRAGVSQMGELIDAMLTLAQVSRSSLLWEQVDLSALAEALQHAHQEREPGRATQLHVEAGLLAQGDPRLLKQVLANLLGNAWKFSAGQACTEITFGRETSSAGETVYFVRDNGVGFDMAYAEKLFGAFQRLHSQSEFAGTGIGLATVQRIIARHGGRVWGEAVPGRGATFYFTLGTTTL